MSGSLGCVFVISDDALAANLMKLAGNVLTATTLESKGEVLTLLRKAGVDQEVAVAAAVGRHMLRGLKITDWRAQGLAAGLAGSAVAAALRAALPSQGSGLA